ncbi:alpha/beta hydrolase [Polycladomyces sp. WAk]|uniref:Alpha/beta hydrolase n=1 Tax=Polycladomyces zharkentensis TaxID=2807616 RepID=A0ABS2WMH6_9BACL|nr:alpha/beta hydrolase [Polycladomyces sp. WAk]MBN2910719.1 alpha/beta hydrolase [Polycladomyces sp. WAk]
MKNIRKYGNPPFTVALIHGGPGAPGEMAPVAKEISHISGTLEPLQTSASIEGQVQELLTLLKKHGDLPVTLIGHSWGAWLSFIFAARYPSLIEKLILIGSGPFEEKYASKIMATRLSRLNEEERLKAHALGKALLDPGQDNKAALSQFGKLLSKADSFDPLPSIGEETEVQPDIFQNVWTEASQLRRSGKLLELGKRIQCPVIAIHGDYDPHPYEGIKQPLSQMIEDFRFILLKNCGHVPWIERTARDRFYEVLKNELS